MHICFDECNECGIVKQVEQRMVNCASFPRYENSKGMAVIGLTMSLQVVYHIYTIRE